MIIQNMPINAPVASIDNVSPSKAGAEAVTINNSNERGASPFVNIGDNFKKFDAVLAKYMPGYNHAIDVIDTDITLSHQMAGSRYHYSFIEHAANDLRRFLVEAQRLDGDGSLYSDETKRKEITASFIFALAEVKADLDVETIADAVNSKMDAVLSKPLRGSDGAVLKGEDGKVITQSAEWVEKQAGQLIDPCPFGIDGERKLDTKNLDRILAYIVDAFHVIRIKGVKGEGIAVWDKYCYSEAEDRIQKIVKDLFKSYALQMDGLAEKVVNTLSLSSRENAFDARLLLPTKTGLVHIFNKKLDAVSSQDFDAQPMLTPFFNGAGFEVCYPDRKVIVTKQLEAAYDPDAYDAEAIQLLKEWSNFNDDLYIVLIQLGGWILLCNKWIKGVAILAGVSGCGKSAYCDALKAMIGANKFSTVSCAQLANKEGFHLSHLVNKRANFAEETEAEALSLKLQNQIKDISGGNGGSTLNDKNIKSYSAIIQANLVFNTNVVPPISDKATRQRVLVVPFLNERCSSYTHNIAACVQRPSFQSTLLNEFIRGAVMLSQTEGRFFADHFHRCDALEQAMQDLEEDGSTEAKWISWYCEQHGCEVDTNGARSMCFLNTKFATCEGVQAKEEVQRTNARHTINALYENSYSQFCEQRKLNKDKPKFFTQFVPEYWQRKGVNMTVIIASHSMPGRQDQPKGRFFSITGDATTHPTPRQAKA